MTPEEILQVEKDIVAILTFDPVWDKSMMSEEALLELNMF